MDPALSSLYLNDVDARQDLGFLLETVTGALDGLSAKDRVTQLPRRVGAILLAPDSQTASRTIQVTGVIRQASMAAVRTAVDQLKQLLYAGTIEVRFADLPDRVYYARCQEKTFQYSPPAFANPRSRVSFTLLCPDPLVYERTGSVIGFSSVRSAVPLGTAVSAPLLRLMGPATNPTITYRDGRGVAKQTMGLTITLLATDYLEINGELFTITKYTSGVSSAQLAALTSGDFLALDPQDGDPMSNVWPTLEVDQGTGEVLYRRAWI